MNENKNEPNQKQTSNSKSKVLLTVLIIILFLSFLYKTFSDINHFNSSSNKQDDHIETINDAETDDEKKEEETKYNTETESKVEEKVNHERFFVLEDKDDLNNYIKEHKLLLLEFRVSWCPYCKEFEERVPEILNENDELTVLQIDIDDHPDLSNLYQAIATPTLILYKNGNLDDRITGALPNDMLLDWINGELNGLE